MRSVEFNFKKFIGLVLLILFGQTSYSNTYLWHFEVSQKNERVLVTWTTADGFSCEDLKVEHSLDTTSTYQVIHVFPGICGTDSSSENYFFPHAEPVNQKPNYYRIDLGRFGKSDWISITPRFIERGKIDVSEHPLSISGQLFFPSVGSDAVLVLVALSGQENRHFELREGQRSFPLNNVGPIASGVYLIWIKDDSAILRRKIVLR